MTGADGTPVPEIVYLDAEDEITSAAARMRRLEAERIALVLPYGSRLATSRINFRLLAREAAARGKRLEIVAADGSARALAGSAGLVVYPSVAALENGEPTVFGPAGGGQTAGGGGAAAAAATTSGGGPASQTFKVGGEDGTETRVIAVPRSPEPPPKVGRNRPVVRTRTALTAGALVVLLVLGGVLGAYLYLPSATIVLTPTAETLGPLSLTVQARTDVAQPDAATLTVPARTYQFGLSATQTFTTTGKKVTEAKATGSVAFGVCFPNGGQTIPAGSTVTTASGIAFETQSTVKLKGPGLFQCSTGTTLVVAALPGISGNVPANAITQAPGHGGGLQVTNPQPTAGGTHEESPQISQEDVDGALAALQTTLRGDLDSKIHDPSLVPAGTTLFDQTASLGTAAPIVDPATLVGQEVASFDLGVTATGTVLGVDPAPVTTVASQRLASQVGDGWQLAPGSTHVDVGNPTVNGDVVSFPVTATATRTRIVDHDALVRQVEGLVLAQARARLEAYGQVQITLWPDWVSSVPTNPDRISLTVGEPAPAPSPTP